MGQKLVSGLTTAAVKAVLDFIKNLILGIAKFYTEKAEDEQTNRENREQLERAETDEERQRANDALAGRLGRR